MGIQLVGGRALTDDIFVTVGQLFTGGQPVQSGAELIPAISRCLAKILCCLGGPNEFVRAQR